MTYEAGIRGKEKATCLECDALFAGSEACQGFEQAASTTASEHSSRPERANRGVLQSADEDVDWLSLTTSTLPSAKTLGIKAQCLRWHEQDPEAKIVIFTQFKGMISVNFPQKSSCIRAITLTLYLDPQANVS